MTVKEVVEDLKQYPGSMKVRMHYYHIESNVDYHENIKKISPEHDTASEEFYILLRVDHKGTIRKKS